MAAFDVYTWVPYFRFPLGPPPEKGRGFFMLAQKTEVKQGPSLRARSNQPNANAHILSFGVRIGVYNHESSRKKLSILKDIHLNRRVH